ncbi:MAG TPA: primosomal protein N', partial [Candidatus Saccharimonadales bacterium]|nr:primosomal protein N' [Candidatus Saccharimonadales bacterium]
HGDEALTYGSDKELAVGTIVLVPLRNKQVLGVVTQVVSAPSFKVKPVSGAPALPTLPKQLIDLMFWVKSYYPSPFGIITQQFLPKELPKKAVDVQSPEKQTRATLPSLTSDQEHAIATVDEPGTYLLHGETGTGKTRVYIELAQKSLDQGKSSIILTPEIGLTSQLANDFRQVFQDRVIVIHSQLTEVTRQRLWVSILKQSEPLIILGPRSALFSPLHSVGFIAVDEAHETAYKQDQSPYYHVSRVASKLAELHKAPVILGSATPLVTDYFVAEARKRPIIRMEQTARGESIHDNQVSVVDLRDRTKFSKKSYLSDKLIAATKEALQRGEQTLLFLNRRGTARVVFCEQCGWQAACPHCDLPLVYHGDTHAMRCHSCEYKAQSPVSCPDCHNASIVFKSIGTKAIVEDVQRLFPGSKVMRFDTDNKKSERIEQHYDAVRSGDVDIIVGTQTLAKGLDLPKLGVVGVIIADTSLYFPDFSAQERTYQLLSQVLGRVGRGHRSTKAVLQTYAPDSPLLEAILKKDWQTFYHRELDERKAFMFPPYCYLLKLACRRATQQSTENAANTFVETLLSSGLRIRVEGPAPAFHERVQNKFQWQVVVKAKDRNELLKVVAMLPSGWSYDIDPMNLL